jgi:chemotaxis protein CheD
MSAQTEVYLQPGEYFVGDASHRIRTLLGSCVSVTLWSPAGRVGAMSHFLLAARGGTSGFEASTHAPLPATLDGRYGDEALRLMLAELARKNVKGPQCEAKIFGGGDMFPARQTTGPLAIGRRNGEAARRLLQSHGIEVISESLFGDGHRQIVFDVASGHVWSRQVRPPATTPREPATRQPA